MDLSSGLVGSLNPALQPSRFGKRTQRLRLSIDFQCIAMIEKGGLCASTGPSLAHHWLYCGTLGNGSAGASLCRAPLTSKVGHLFLTVETEFAHLLDQGRAPHLQPLRRMRDHPGFLF